MRSGVELIGGGGVAPVRAGEPLSVTGNGSQTRLACHVEDTVCGILALAEFDAAGPVNIGAPYELSMTELTEAIIELSGSAASIRYVERPIDDPRVRRPDIPLAQDLLDWQPRVSLNDGLARTICWFRAELPATAEMGTARAIRPGPIAYAGRFGVSAVLPP